MANNTKAEVEPTLTASGDEDRGGSGRNWLKAAALLIWIAVIIAYWQYSRVNSLTPLQTVQQLITLLATSSLGIAIYIFLYVIRPAVFFPATLLTLAAGYLYGPIWGVLIVVVASNLSSLLAYAIGRFFGTTDAASGEATQARGLQRYVERLRNNSFETVLTMRFLFLPYDLVSYVSGLLRVNWQAFILATALGSIPGTISFVLFGASIEGDFTGELPSINTTTLIIAALMFVVSLVLSRWFKRREAKQTEAA